MTCFIRAFSPFARNGAATPPPTLRAAITFRCQRWTFITSREAIYVIRYLSLISDNSEGAAWWKSGASGASHSFRFDVCL